MKLHYALLAGIALALASGNSTQAGPVLGTLGLQGGPTTVSGNNILGALPLTFALGDLTSTTGGGRLATLPPQDFGPKTFSTDNVTPLTFSSTEFGSFSSKDGSIMLISQGAMQASFLILGSYTPGTVPGGPATDASILIQFNQLAGPNTPITSAATFAYPAIAIPEPQSLSLIGIGLASVSFFRKLRKRMGK